MAAGGLGPILEIEDLAVVYGAQPPVHAVRDVSLTIRRGERVGIVGESGSGKSTLLWALVDLLPAGGEQRGSVRFPGLDLEGVGVAAGRGSSVGIVMQNAREALAPFVPMREQFLKLPGAVRRLSRVEALSEAQATLRSVGVPDPSRVLDSYVHELSGGMAARAALALVLMNRPALLLADEPTTGLDATTQLTVLEVLQGHLARFESTLLLVSHDLGVVRHVCDRVVVMRQGEFLEDLPAEEFFAGPRTEYGRQLLRGAALDLRRRDGR